MTGLLARHRLLRRLSERCSVQPFNREAEPQRNYEKETLIPESQGTLPRRRVIGKPPLNGKSLSHTSIAFLELPSKLCRSYRSDPLCLSTAEGASTIVT